jgi:eukaryotic-like serine/threonine-protein kinase
MGLELQQGTVLAGRFRLERLLGKGGMGVVWSATNTATGRRVAIKLLREDSGDDPQVRRRFLREGRAASAVQHPNVVEILDVLELDGDRPAMVMELLEGESLGHRLRREGKLALSDVASLLVHAVAATGAAHAHGIVHRDLKPDNIFLAKGRSEGEIVVKVLDFGIAKMITEVEQKGSTLLTNTGSMLGTPSYMAPEQLFSEGTLDYRADIWAFGVILYECLAGRRPARGETFADIVKIIATRAIVPIEKVLPDVPADVAKLIGRMLSFDADERPKSLLDVCQVLAKYTDAKHAPFGDPLLESVKKTGGLDKALIPLLLEQAAETPVPGPAAPATLDVMALTETAAVPREAETQNHLGQTLSVASTAPRRPRKTLPYVVGVAAAAIVLGFAARGAMRSAETPSASASPPPLAPVVEVAPVVTVAPSPSPSPSTSTSTTLGAPSASVARTSIARPRATAVPAPVASDLRSPAAPATATAAQTTSPGGLVEKPPF